MTSNKFTTLLRVNASYFKRFSQMKLITKGLYLDKRDNDSIVPFICI